jgi:hypothetical protein
MAMQAPRRWVWLLGFLVVHAGCQQAGPADPSAAAAPAAGLLAPASAGGPARAQAVPDAVFATTPAADAAGRIAGAGPLGVQFNMCRSRATDPGDELRFTYDWDADGAVDEHGHCRARHVFTSSAQARVCVSDRRPDGAVCRTYAIAVSDEPPPAPEHVLRLAVNSCQQSEQLRYQYLEARMDPPLPANQAYAISLTIDGELGAAPYRQTLADGGGRPPCVDWQGYTADASPLPNEHTLAVPPRACQQDFVYLLGVIESPPGPPAAGLRMTVTGFAAPGRRTRIEGPTSFTCP